MTLIDSHAHLCALREHLPQILERAAQAGVVGIVNIATTFEELEFALTIESKVPKILLSASTTPHDVAMSGEKDFEPIRKKALEGKLHAIGETGLDYHYEHSPRDLQKHFLRKYLRLAAETNLPIIFHCREAFEDLFRITEEEKYSGKAILHCFTGTLAEAKEVVARGWMVSFSGIVTFKKLEELRKVAREIPLDHILIETDAPYLAPGPFRGQINEPAYIIETAKTIAEARNMPLRVLEEALLKNILTIFPLFS